MPDDVIPLCRSQPRALFIPSLLIGSTRFIGAIQSIPASSLAEGLGPHERVHCFTGEKTNYVRAEGAFPE